MRKSPLHSLFDKQTHPVAADRVAAWRDAMSVTVDVAFTPDEERDFEGGLEFLPFGRVLLVVGHATPHTAIRSKETIARSGGAHVILDAFPRGGFRGLVGSRRLTVVSGDCVWLDLRHTLHVHLEEFHYIGVVIPRGMLEERAGGNVNVHGLHLPSSDAETRSVSTLLQSLVDQAPRMSSMRAEPMGAALVSFLCGCMVGSGEIVRRWSSAPTVAQVLRYIERHAHDPNLGPAHICAAFQLSRTAVYDLLKPHGGVATLIRRRRTDLARRLLVAKTHRTDSLDAIAYASGFANERAMRRALREVYDTTPLQTRLGCFDRESTIAEHAMEIAALLDARR